MELEKMEALWFFWLRFYQADDSAYDSPLEHTCTHSYDSDSNYNSITSENQP